MMHSALETLNATKLYIPPVPPGGVLRPRLIERLNAGLCCKLILLSAPPGFGKTTLASQWLARCDKPSAWISLDEGDNQLAQFLRYLVAALHNHAPAACPTTASLLAAAELPPVDYLADVLVSELTALPSELVLVLDDYHLIRSSKVHHLVRYLLRYLPPQLHLVVLTRSDPPLELGRLRLEQQVAELRAEALRFALDETRAFMQSRIGKPLDDDVLQSLYTRTEGWIIGLQSASISLQLQDPREFLACFGGSDRLLTDYLVEQVMAHLPRGLGEFLLRTAIVDRFCAPLGEVLMADSRVCLASRAAIAELQARNLFIIPLDAQGCWYRYHDLFRDFLRQRLERAWAPPRLACLHQRASAWFAGAGLIDQALHHALAAGDQAGAAALVETHLHPALNQAPASTLERWLDQFAEPVVNAHAGLLLAQVYWLVMGRWDFHALPALLARLETLLNGDDDGRNADRRQSLQADLDLLRGMVYFWQGEPLCAIDQLQRALDHLPTAHAYARAQATIYLAAAFASSGQRATCSALLQTALAETMAHQHPATVIFLGVLSIIAFGAGELAEAARTAEQVLAVAEAPQVRAAWRDVGFVQTWLAWAHYVLGAVHYEWNKLEGAERHWRQVETLRYQANRATFFHALVGLVLIAQARHVPEDARAYSRAARAFALESRSLALLATADSLEVRLGLFSFGAAQDQSDQALAHLAPALRRARAINTAVNDGVEFWQELPRLTRVRALLASARGASAPAALTAALKLTETCLRQAQAVHNTRQVIAITALQALALHALRRTTEAFRALQDALTLGEPGDFVRTFLDLGAPMAELLSEFARKNHKSKYARRLLAAFAREQHPTQPRALAAQHTSHYNVTPLTRRELEMLTLVSQRLSIQEIAETLVISPNTVKKHSHNIYSKLGVRNRRQAIAKAHELGWLPPA